MKAVSKLVRFAMLAAVCLVAMTDAMAQEIERTESGTITVTGTVRDKENRKKLENVMVSLVGTSIGTVTNADGFFSLKIPEHTSAPQLELSHIGYLNTRFSVSASNTGEIPAAVIWMTSVTRQLGEVVVYSGNARRIVEEALMKIPDNYPSSENMLSAFYRETIQKRKRYISISEAMMDVYKTAYTSRNTHRDRVQLIKARRLLSQRSRDTLSVKVAGGPILSTDMDIVKNPYALFDRESIEYYKFEQEASVMMDNRIQYVISFKPRVKLEYALLEGKVYIDSERMSFTRAEFSLDVSDSKKATASILRRKPAGLRFRPLSVDFLISYREHNGVTALHYICNDIRFKCDWKRRLFSSTYTVRSEMVVVEREDHPDRVITRKQAFKPKQIFYDEVKEYWNEDYWKDYNIIEPTETLENAVKKLKK